MDRIPVAQPVAPNSIPAVRPVAEGAAPAAGGPPPSAPARVLDLAREALRAAEGQVPRFSHRRSPRTYTQHQLFALLVLRRFLGWDFRAVASLAARSPSLREAIGLGRAPHYSTLCYAEGRLLGDARTMALLEGLVARVRLLREPGIPAPGAA